MLYYQGEPSLTETLSDPMVQAVMAADAVDPAALEVLLRETARAIELRQHRSRPTAAEATSTVEIVPLPAIAKPPRTGDPIFAESARMQVNPSRSPALALPTSTLSRWLARFGFATVAEQPAELPSLDIATIVAGKEDRRVLRNEASRRAEKPPLPFS